MNVEALTRQFARIGAHIEIAERPSVRGRNGDADFSLDIREEGRREFYLLEIAKPAIETVEFQVLNTRAELRHLVLMARNASTELVTKEKFLCGHDERHWFVASLPNGAVTDVNSAMESLKSRDAAWALRRSNVRKKNHNKRHNAAFIRQGEWFFVPVPQMSPINELLILKNEPLSRGAGSKPHIVSELFRTGGQLVYVNRRTNTVMNAAQFEARLRSGRLKNARDWQMQRSTSNVFVRGKVRHADHKTIELKGWHRVSMNAEPISNTVAFLD